MPSIRSSTGDDASVDSTPSWAAPIQSALQRLKNAKPSNITTNDSDGKDDIFRSPNSTPTSTPASQQQEERQEERQEPTTESTPKTVLVEDRTRDKFVSSLSKIESDDRSTSSNRSNRSNRSSLGSQSGSSISNGQSGTHVPKGITMQDNITTNNNGKNVNSAKNALMLATSIDSQDVDDDPNNMIESINDILTECRVILDD